MRNSQVMAMALVLIEDVSNHLLAAPSHDVVILSAFCKVYLRSVVARFLVIFALCLSETGSRHFDGKDTVYIVHMFAMRHDQCQSIVFAIFNPRFIALFA